LNQDPNPPAIIEDLKEAKHLSTYTEKAEDYEDYQGRTNIRTTYEEYWGEMPQKLEFCKDNIFADLNTVHVDPGNPEDPSLNLICETLENNENINVITHSSGSLILAGALSICPDAKINFLTTFGPPWQGTTDADLIYIVRAIGMCNDNGWGTFVSRYIAKSSQKYCGALYEFTETPARRSMLDMNKTCMCRSNNPVSLRDSFVQELGKRFDSNHAISVCTRMEDVLFPPESCISGGWEHLDTMVVEETPTNKRLYTHEMMMHQPEVWERVNQKYASKDLEVPVSTSNIDIDVESLTSSRESEETSVSEREDSATCCGICPRSKRRRHLI